jgi:hypothetical protein
MRQFCRKGSSAVIGSILMLMGIAACSNLSAPAPPLGHLQVFVTDSATGVGVGGLPMTLYVGSVTGLAWAQLRTSTDGTGEFRPGDGGVIIQPYVVNLDLSSSTYALAANETNNKPVTVLVGQTVTVTFKLHKGALGPPGT